VIDVRPLEADDVGEQRVRLAQRLVGGNVDRRPAVPAKCFERLVDELARFALGQSAPWIRLSDVRALATAARRKASVAPGNNWN